MTQRKKSVEGAARQRHPKSTKTTKGSSRGRRSKNNTPDEAPAQTAIPPNPPQSPTQPQSPDGATTAAAPSPTEADPVRRAEETLDHLATRVGDWASILGRKLVGLAAQAGEQAGGIWAEARQVSGHQA
jgi:hypothetical protein